MVLPVRMRTSGFVPFGVATLCCAQVAAPGTAPPTVVYHSEVLNLDFAYPSSFSAPKDGDGEAAGEHRNASQKEDAGCSSLPIAVMDMRTEFNMIFVQRLSSGCLSSEITAANLVTVTSSVVNIQLKQFGKPTLGRTADYELAGHVANVVSGSVTVPHARGKNTIYDSTSCVISGKNIACFQFLSNECSKVATLATSTVQFKDSAAVPAVPAQLSIECKP
jgi:hypothetical protein